MSTTNPDPQDTEQEPTPSLAQNPVKTGPDPDDCYECRACGYVYEPSKGDNRGKIVPNTAFSDLPKLWRCPICNAPQMQFVNIGAKNKPSGFQENLGYGLGVNTLTPGQKNLLIFGSLALAFLFFMSLYGLK
ncbi:MAG: rubredoxin [Prochlorotrichaceae cyanobacterium]|jgi:rubredoxin